MRRREFIGGLLLGVAVRQAQAQQTTRVYRIAFAEPALPISELAQDPYIQIFFEELRHLGYVEKQNLLIELYSGGAWPLQYPQLARDVVRQNPDLIVVMSSALLPAFKAATTSIPIVGFTADPVAYGIIPSLARPGGNITGISTDAGLEIWGKRVQILKEVMPSVSKVGFLASQLGWDGPYGRAIREAAGIAKISLVGPPLEPPFPEREYRRVLSAMAQEGTEALIVPDGPYSHMNRRLIVELTNQARLPSIFSNREFVEIGGLMAYGFDLPDGFRHAAHQVDLVLKGRKPSDVPYYQLTKFGLTINLKTARALGITIPLSLLASADEVIE